MTNNRVNFGSNNIKTKKSKKSIVKKDIINCDINDEDEDDKDLPSYCEVYPSNIKS